jgi:hypothetical protein
MLATFNAYLKLVTGNHANTQNKYHSGSFTILYCISGYVHFAV